MVLTPAGIESTIAIDGKKTRTKQDAPSPTDNTLDVNNHHCCPAASRTTANALLSGGYLEPVHPCAKA